MSDTSAPAAAPPAQAPQSPQQAPQAPQPSQAPQEAVVSPGPSRTAPVGSQLPPERRASDTARNAIEAAYERPKTPPPKQAKAPAHDDKAPKAAEAKQGHNQPPEETPKLDLKKRPDEQAQPRGERGQFAPRQSPDPSTGAEANGAQNRAQTDANGAQTPYI